LILFLAPVYVPLTLLKAGSTGREHQPGHGLPRRGARPDLGVHNHTGLAFACALALIAVALVWTLSELRNAEASP